MCLPLALCCPLMFLGMFFVGIFMRLFPLALSFISFFLLGFLLIGCASTNSSYSSVYLVKVAFNETLDAYTGNGTTGSLRVNYMALCSTTTGAMECSTLRNYTALSAGSMVDTPAGSLSLADLASQLNDVCTPYILVTALVLVFMILLCELWLAIPLVPWKVPVRRFAAVIALLCALLWGLGAMLQHQAIRCAQVFISAATLSAVLVSRGSRAEAMSWTSFAFLVLVFIALVFRVVRDAHVRQRDEK